MILRVLSAIVLGWVIQGNTSVAGMIVIGWLVVRIGWLVVRHYIDFAVGGRNVRLIRRNSLAGRMDSAKARVISKKHLASPGSCY